MNVSENIWGPGSLDAFLTPTSAPQTKMKRKGKESMQGTLPTSASAFQRNTPFLAYTFLAAPTPWPQDCFQSPKLLATGKASGPLDKRDPWLTADSA